MKRTQQTPERLTAENARIRALAADHIARGVNFGLVATERQRLQARRLVGPYQHAAELLAEVDSE